MCFFVFTNPRSFQQFLVLSRSQWILNGALTALRSTATSRDDYPNLLTIKLTNQLYKHNYYGRVHWSR